LATSVACLIKYAFKAKQNHEDPFICSQSYILSLGLNKEITGTKSFFLFYDHMKARAWSDAKECDNFEFGETENDWIKVLQKLSLVFMILEVWSTVFALKPFLSYKPKSIIGGASCENIQIWSLSKILDWFSVQVPSKHFRFHCTWQVHHYSPSDHGLDMNRPTIFIFLYPTCFEWELPSNKNS